MKLRRVITVFIASVFLLFSLAPPRLTAKSPDDLNLFRAKTIFLQANQTTEAKEWAVERLRLLPLALKEALLVYGFKVVDNSEDADATMEVDVSEWATLDGPQPDPPKHGFHFLLVSSKYNVKWETAFDISTRANESEYVRKAAHKFAGNLFQAWKKSAKKAGINVGDKLP